MSSIFNSETPLPKIDASKLRIEGSGKRFKTLEEYVMWPFGQKNPELVRRFYAGQEKARKKSAMTDAPDAPF